jgi:hypothetical protein
MLQRWPTATALAAASRHDLVAFARAAHSGYPDRFADRVGQALGRDRLTARQRLAQAKVDTIQLTVAQLLLIGAQRRAWERRMGQLLLGAPRRRGGVLPAQADRDRGQALPGGQVYLSFRAWVTASRPGSPVRSATIPNNSRHRIRCNAMPARPR